MVNDRKNSFNRIQATLMDNFGISRNAAVVIMMVIGLIIIFACFWFFYTAPPKKIIITSGEQGSLYHTIATRYAKILARDGVKLVVLPSAGSVENLKRMTNPSFKADIAFVQAGLTKGQNIDKLVSLGSIAYQPLMVFHRGDKPVEILSQLAGKRIVIGAEGSGTRSLALALLAANGIEPDGKTKLLDMDDEVAANALLAGTIDAAFLMADSASSKIMRKLMKEKSIHLVSFSQADGYIRRISYLNKLMIPKGAIDFGENVPASDIYLVSPAVELIARDTLHPALSDLLLAAATEIHGRPTLYQKRGEFPAPIGNEFRISDDAQRFYKSGKSFFFRYLPFWLASLINRVLVVFVPLILILIPAFKTIPTLYRWQMRMRILKWYRALLLAEEDIKNAMTPQKRAEMMIRINEIEAEVNKMKVPASFGDQFYMLRGHINFVRDGLQEMR